MRRFWLALLLVSVPSFAAVDSANKRGSVVNLGQVAHVLPVPNSAVDAGDRAQLAGFYRGIVDDASGGGGGSGTSGDRENGFGFGFGL